MPIPWKAIQRRNPRDPNAAAKYYALDMTRSLLDEDDYCSLSRPGGHVGYDEELHRRYERAMREYLEQHPSADHRMLLDHINEWIRNHPEIRNRIPNPIEPYDDAYRRKMEEMMRNEQRIEQGRH